jgi:DNA gyrase/topoisomerase IV subunit A
MEDMDKDTVDFQPNYDERLTEPVVFPSAFPNLIVNGGTGIAVGMATNMPPHNLGEVVDGICAQIDNPDITVPELMEHIKGPDFPTGCTIYGRNGTRLYMNTGRGSVKVRGKVEIEQDERGREQIIITEIPYRENRAVLIKRIAELVTEKILPEISGIRDECDEKTRIVLELKRDARPQVVINNLYRHTALESSFSVNMLAIDNRRPRLLTIRDAIACYIDHRREVVLRRTRYLLRKAEARAEILEALLLATSRIDDFIRIIRDSRNRDEAEARIKALHPGGSTALVDGWRAGMEALRDGHGIEQHQKRLLLLTDGQANIGPRRGTDVAPLVAAAWNCGVSTSCISLGENYDERFLSAMARFAAFSTGAASDGDDFLSSHPSTPDRIQKATEIANMTQVAHQAAAGTGLVMLWKQPGTSWWNALSPASRPR